MFAVMSALPFCLFGMNSAPSPVKGAPAGEAFTLDQMVQWECGRADCRHPAEQPPSQAVRATPQYLVFPARRAYHIVEPITNYGITIAYTHGILSRSLAPFPHIAALLS